MITSTFLSLFLADSWAAGSALHQEVEQMVPNISLALQEEYVMQESWVRDKHSEASPAP